MSQQGNASWWAHNSALSLLVVMLIALVSLPLQARQIADAGQGVELQGTPQRVVVLEYSFLDAALAAGVRPVGVTDDGRPERILPALRAQLGDYRSLGLRAQPELETIASLKPDLIIADSRRHLAIYDELRAIAPTLLLHSYGAAYPQLMDDAATIAEALNRQPEFEARMAAHRQRMAAAATTLKGQPPILYAVVTTRGFVAHGAGSFASSVMTELGLDAALPASGEQSYQRISFEQLAAINPAWLFYSDYTASEQGDRLAYWREHPMWGFLNAVQQQQVVAVEPAAWSLGRGLLGAELIAADLVAYTGAGR